MCLIHSFVYVTRLLLPQVAMIVATLLHCGTSIRKVFATRSFFWAAIVLSLLIILRSLACLDYHSQMYSWQRNYHRSRLQSCSHHLSPVPLEHNPDLLQLVLVRLSHHIIMVQPRCSDCKWVSSKLYHRLSPSLSMSAASGWMSALHFPNSHHMKEYDWRILMIGNSLPCANHHIAGNCKHGGNCHTSELTSEQSEELRMYTKFAIPCPTLNQGDCFCSESSIPTQPDLR
jgi:hypothetical protein